MITTTGDSELERPTWTVLPPSSPCPQTPSFISGISFGEALSSTQTLHAQSSLPRMKSLDQMIASESQSSTGSTSTSGWRGNEIPYEPSFEVEVGDIKAVDSGWLDDDVEEVMVVKKKKRKPLSVIIEATEGIQLSPTKPRVTVAGTVNASDFEYIRTLKVAQYGESLIARKPDTGTVHTVKLVRKSGRSASELARRVAAEQKIMRVLTECSVPFAARLHWSFEDDRAMYLVIDRTDGSSLRNVIEAQGPLLPHDAVLCAAELIDGISGLHALGIVHTSLRPESIFVGEDGHVFISDFDDAVFLQDDVERQETSCGTPRTTTSPEYQAPEMVLEWEYDYAVDWWSFGLVLFWTLTGTHPFTHVGDAETPFIIRSKVLHATLTGDRLGMDEDAYQLISRCLQRNPALRIDGVGVKMHAYFEGIDWKDVAAKQIEAPFACHSGLPLPELDDNELDFGHDALPVATSAADSFAFDWKHSALSAGTTQSSGLSEVRDRLQALRADHRFSDTTLKPEHFAASPILDEISASASSPDLQTQGSPSGEFGTLPSGVSGSSARIGNLRRYSSLTFDLQSSHSRTSMRPVAEDSAGERAASVSPVPLRHARSILGLSLTLGSADDSLDSPSWASRLRRRTRPETPPLVVPPPPPELPKGVRQIGSGIGYTRRAETRRSVLTLASLTPRTCQSMFSGRLPKFGGRRKQKEHGEKGGGASSGGEPSADADEGDGEEDPMDEVMREIYGDDWAAAAGCSPVEGQAARRGGSSVRLCERDGGRVGLGWDDALTRFRSRPVDASFAGPDSTLRLVSPSTPRLGMY